MSNTARASKPDFSPPDPLSLPLLKVWALPLLREDAEAMDRVAETLYALARPKDHPLQTPLLRAALVRAGSSLAMAADYHRQLLEKAESRVLELNREGDES